MKSDDPKHVSGNFNQTYSTLNHPNTDGRDSKFHTIRSCGDNMYQTHSQGSKSSTLDQTKQTNKSKKKEDVQPPPWCSSVKKDTKNKLYSKVKHKLEDVSIVLGFNTARGDQDENLQINGSKYKKSKTR